jgi:hypothetical protein
MPLAGRGEGLEIRYGNGKLLKGRGIYIQIYLSPGGPRVPENKKQKQGKGYSFIIEWFKRAAPLST